MTQLREAPPFARLMLATVVLGLFAGGSPAFAQPDSLEGLEIRRIEVDASPDADIPRIRETIRVREGDFYRAARIRADVAALYALGAFKSVTVEPVPSEDGLALVYRLTSRLKVSSVTFEGNLELAESELRPLVQSKSGMAISPYLLTLDRETLRNHYVGKGYVFADVLQTTAETDEGIEVRYTVEAGPKLRIESIRFEGNDAVEDSELQRVMISTKATTLLGGSSYDPNLLRSDLLEIREIFRRKGYLDATVGHEVLYEQGRQRAYLLVKVHQGPLYRIERLLLRGMAILTPDEILSVMKIREGSPYSQEQLERDFEAIRDLYGEKGYIKTEVKAERVFSANEPSATLTVAVTEGRKYYVNRVFIRGNRRTADHVIRREVTLLPGEVADTTQLKTTKRLLTNTGLFFSTEKGFEQDPVGIRFIDTSEPDKVDVLLDVVEGGMGNFQIGAGISSEMGLVGDLRLTFRNFDALDFPGSWRELLRGEAFTGGGQKLTLSATPGTTYQDYRLGWLNPSVYDSPYSVGFDVYLHELSWAGFYDEQRTGIAFTVGRKITPDLTVNLTPRYESIRVDNVDSSAPTDAANIRGTHERRSLTLSVLYDKRDNIFLTTEGYTFEGSVEMAGTLLGGDVDFLREMFGARKWLTVWEQENWGKHVISFGGDLALTQSTGSGNVPLFDRLFMGGLGSLRGFDYRGTGPVDSKTNEQIGGAYRVLGHVEYEAPLYKDYLRGVLFTDTGSLARSAGDIPDEFRTSVGIGVRARLPVLGLQQVPFSVYLAIPVSKQKRDEEEFFSFTLGTGFEF